MNAKLSVATIRSFGGARHRRLLMLVMYLDVSGSMSGARIEAVNFAIEAVLKLLQQMEQERRGFDLRVLAVTFGERPQIIIPNAPIDSAYFKRLAATDGETKIGPAFELVAAEFDRVKDEAGVSPVELLVTDGMTQDRWQGALARLKKTAYGSKSRRLAVRIGDGVDEAMLMEFLGGEGVLLPADQPEEIVNAIVKNVSESVSGVLLSHSVGGVGASLSGLVTGNLLPLVSSDNS